MTYSVILIESDEGIAIGCPALPGCWTQGANREEAIANIKEAISLWREVEEEDIRHDLEAEGTQYTRESVTV